MLDQHSREPKKYRSSVRIVYDSADLNKLFNHEKELSHITPDAVLKYLDKKNFTTLNDIIFDGFFCHKLWQITGEKRGEDILTPTNILMVTTGSPEQPRITFTLNETPESETIEIRGNSLQTLFF